MWKVKIVDMFDCCWGSGIYIYQKSDNNSVRVLQSDGEMVKTIKECDKSEPTIKLPEGVLGELLNALLERGIKPKEQSHVEGLLEATKYHLEDMRQMVFKTNKAPTK